MSENNLYLTEIFEELEMLSEDKYLGGLVNRLSVLLNVETVWLAAYNSAEEKLSSLVTFSRGKFTSEFDYKTAGTPCAIVIDSRSTCVIEEEVSTRFLNSDKYLDKFEAVGYVGVPLLDGGGRIVGVLAACKSEKLLETKRLSETMTAFAEKAQGFLQKTAQTTSFRQKEEQLKGLIDGIQDLLINFDEDGQVVMMNVAAKNILKIKTSTDTLSHVKDFLSKKQYSDLQRMIYNLGKSEESDSFLFFPELFQVETKTDGSLEVEGTLNQYRLNEKCYYTMVLRSLELKTLAEKELRSLLDKTNYLQSQLEEVKVTSQLIGDSDPIKLVWQDIYMVAHTDATVLILGETGTGKELVAKQIHEISSRKSKPIVSINCGAIPPNLIESELFGHVKGAFTGAVTDRKGRFELADGGTVFLDEIGELPLEMQVKILRVIQEQEFEPVGSSKTVKVDLRIIAATHRDLMKLIKEGDFREDLFYRLNVFPIEVPALRERGDDIIILAKNFIEKFSKRMTKKVNELSVVQKRVLLSYDWPGNVRELQNIVERAVIMTRDGYLDIAKVLGVGGTQESGNDNSGFLIEEGKVLKKSELIALEKKNILLALRQSDGKVSGKGGAAELLGMVPSTLSSRMQSLGLYKSFYEIS